MEIDALNKLQTIKAIEVGSVTLVGFRSLKPPPYPVGNCFSLKAENDIYYKILNFNYENFDYIVKHKLIEYPVEILPLSKNCAVIHDFRIPHEWYPTEFCSSCTPQHLLPIPQRLEQLRDVKASTRIETEQFTYITRNVIDPKWTIDPLVWKAEIDVNDKKLREIYTRLKERQEKNEGN